MRTLTCLLTTLLLLIQCKPKEQEVTSNENSLGEVVLQVTGSEEAMPFFTQGLLLLHSFEFEDAAEQFVKAQDLDSTFVMAYWGEAMTYNHPLWRERYTEEGSAALNKLGASSEVRLSMAKTDIEKDFLDAVEVLYSEGDKIELDIAYKEKMQSMYKKYPGNHEVAAFYALSLLGASKSRTEDDFYDRGAKIVQGIIDENPKHPGALHYLIHSYDDPDHATLALDAAHSYAQVAPDAEHALHMPSHIFVALGMWDEVIRSNIASYEASVVRMKEKEMDNDARGYHAFKWLMYGYLQKGEKDIARNMLYEMKQYATETPSSRARAHYIMMQGDYLTETGDWGDSIALHTVDLEKLNLQVQGVQYFTQGNLAYYQEDEEKLRSNIEELNRLQAKAETIMVSGNPKMCSGVSRYLQPPSKNEVNSVEVMILELEAFTAMLKGEDAKVEEHLKKAVELEETIKYSFGPPNIVKPSFEMYGEWLLKKGRLEEAMTQFEKSLERMPNRRLSVKGKEQCEVV